MRASPYFYITLNIKDMEANNISRSRLWTARIMSGLVILFMIVDAGFKFVNSPEAIKATTDLGYSEHHLVPLGVMALIATTLYVIPTTAVLGAVLLTGYFGGAIATHFRLGNPLFSHTLFPTYLAILMWGGLWLRNKNLRTVFPFNS
jgi:hypothetical protein